MAAQATGNPKRVFRVNLRRPGYHIHRCWWPVAWRGMGSQRFIELTPLSDASSGVTATASVINDTQLRDARIPILPDCTPLILLSTSTTASAEPGAARS